MKFDIRGMVAETIVGMVNGKMVSESDLTDKRLHRFDEGEVLRLVYHNPEEEKQGWMIVKVVVEKGKKRLESYGGWKNSSFSEIADIRVPEDISVIWQNKIPHGLANKILLDGRQKPRLYRIKEAERVLYDV